MLTGIGFEHEKFNFPVGEMHVKLTDFAAESPLNTTPQ